MEPRQAKVFNIAENKVTCAFDGCEQLAGYGVRFLNKSGELTKVGQDLCEQHYQQQVHEGAIQIVELVQDGEPVRGGRPQTAP